ncbi:MAG: energy-coupled thiamine transporter ThiT, partial [Clostridia bacterium]|nr:energy-coupled thiamine transporter ThiT [Clostridia bacterium]
MSKKPEASTGGVSRPVLRLTESAVLLALATVLSLVKLVDLPYGGSVTAASAVPLVILAYRHGFGWGTLAGLAYGLLQLAFSSSLSYVTGFWSVVAVLVL